MRAPGLDSGVPLAVREFQALARLVYDASGVRLGPEKRELVAARLRPLLRALDEPSFERLVRSIRGDATGERLTLVLDRVTTNTTGFFRHAVHFELLREAVASWKSRGRIRLWSAGCSTGEEPYSAALVLLEAQATRDSKVLATDISTRALRRASEAVYSSEAIAPVPPTLRRYFESADETSPARARASLPRRARSVASDGRVRVGEAARALVHLRHHDLRQTSVHARGVFDAVFCRNVLIYFDAADRAGAIARLAEALRPGGLFFLGPCETGVQLPATFARIGPAAYRKD